ncbi:MAG: AI-2E family transporter [Clostridiaceae bacterium]|nr:AI-2E family transporter [Clostridiaceae bacterium]
MEINRSMMKKLMLLILYTIVLLGLAFRFELVCRFFRWCAGLFLPFLIGAAIAFILNVPMRRLEALLPKKRRSRGLSLVLTLILVLGVLGIVCLVVIPELTETLMSLTVQIPRFFERIRRWVEVTFEEYPELVTAVDGMQLEIDWKQAMERLIGFITTGAGTVLSSTVTAALSIASGLASFSIAFIFSIYLLLQKETLTRQAKKLLYAYFPEARVNIWIRVLRMTEQTFSKFLAGQCLEAVILGLMFFVSMTFFRLPYALLIGVLIAFTALIPIFGAFIGCAVGIFLTLTVNPLQAVWFTILFFVLQQLEGNLIYHHVVGNSVGLPSIWVLVAVSVGGSMFGIVGMLVFIPLCSVCYALLREDVNRRLKRKAGAVKTIKKEGADE